MDVNLNACKSTKFGCKTTGFMRAIAEGNLAAVGTPAQGNTLLASSIEDVTISIFNNKIAFDANRAVVDNGNCSRHRYNRKK